MTHCITVFSDWSSLMDTWHNIEKSNCIIELNDYGKWSVFPGYQVYLNPYNVH